jgi:MFS family permease
MTFEDYRHGISDNLEQFLHQLFQVLLVGMTLGLMRTVVPALAETEFGVPRGSFLLLMAFVVAFGFVKGALNFLAGRLSERFGRRNVLLAGWFVAIPVPIIVYMAPSWGWIVFATVLLGVNQGLTWSMTQTSKLDVTRADQRGLTIGLNEFSGYLGVAIGGVMTGYLSEWMAPRSGLLVFGLTTITLAIINAWFWVKETLPWAKAEALRHAEGRHEGPLPRFPQNFPDKPTTKEMFWLMSWGDKRMAAFCQAGLVEKFVDALIWVFYPVYFYQRGLGLAEIGWVVGVYGFVWGGSQFLTGKLSDHVGRMWPIISGMWICGAGIGITLLGDSVLWWSFSAAVTGFGMALLYPNISAAVSDIAHPNWRGSAIGIYRFWRDLGYGIGALLLGLVANTTGIIDTGFWFVTIAMFVSGLLVWIMAEETHPRLNPAR